MTNTGKLSARSAKAESGIVSALVLLIFASVAWAQYPGSFQIGKDGTALLLEDYANAPLSAMGVADGVYPPPIDFHDELGRINSLRSEPAGAPLAASRFFVNDLNGTLYILDKNTKKFSPYINFPEIFPRFTTEKDYAGGIVSIAFDPAYAKNGKFYTVHTEKPSATVSAIPTNSHLPSLNLDGYTLTAASKPPAGPADWESVLVEWTDTNIGNATFEGSAREILRVGFGKFMHQMNDMVFNPLARPGQADYRNLYISVGDGAAGETPGITHTFPQQLDTLQGKILRITPDVTLRPKDMLSSNGRYRIPSTGPDPNPFVSVRGARGEIFAYGLRNPHRMTWDAVTNTLLANDIGLHAWEEVNIITKGANYGWAEREGNEVVIVPGGGKTGSQVDPPIPVPDPDLLIVEGLEKPVIPLYPAAVYSHQEGDSISSGFVYRGKLMPQMDGKYIFGDITTARLFYANLTDMIAGHGARNHQAEIHELQIMYKSPYDSSIQTPAKRRMYDIIADAYAHKDGKPNPDSSQGVLPEGSATVGGWRGKVFRPSKADPYGVPYGGGRADVRLAMGGDGELYVLSKSDGMIRKFVSVVTPPPASK